MQRKLLLLVALAALAGLVFLGVHFGSLRPGSGGADAPARPRAAGASSAGAALGEPDAARPAGAAGAALAPLETDAGSREDPSSARALDVQLALPEGLPADESIAVWGFAQEPSVDLLVDDPALAAASFGRAEELAPGHFRLALPPGAERAFVFARGRYAYARSAVPAALEGPAAVLPLELGAWIRGVIAAAPGTDAASLAALAGLDVKLAFGPDDFGAGSELLASAGKRRTQVGLSDGALTFEFGGVPTGGANQLEILPDAWAAWESAELALEPGRAREVRAELDGGGSIAGRVVDESGQGIGGALVRAEQNPRFMGMGGLAVRSATSAPDGSFELAAVRAGTTWVLADPADALEASVKVEVLLGRATSGVLVAVPRGKSIAGRASYSGGAPAAAAEVSAVFDVASMSGTRALNAYRGAAGSARASADGSFEIRGLGDGPFKVSAWAPPPGAGADFDAVAQRELGHSAQVYAVEPALAGGGAALELELHAPTGLAGRVLDLEGRPVTDFEVRASLPSESDMLAREKVSESVQDEQGRFFLANLAHGTWKLSAGGPGYADSADVLAAVPAEAELEIRLAPAAVVTGRVRTPDGAPAADAWVTTYLDRRSYFEATFNGRPIPRAEADAEGRFELGGLPAGELGIVAGAPGFASSAVLAVPLAAGQTLADQVLVLRVGGTISVEVFDAEGAPSTGRVVTIQTAQGEGQQTAKTDERGRHVFENVLPGAYQVIALGADLGAIEGGDAAAATSAMLEGLKMKSVEVADGEEVHVVLGERPKAPVRVAGRVTLDGDAVPGALVQAFPAVGGLGGMKMKTTGADGRFDLTLDEPGFVLFSVSQRSPEGLQRQSVELPCDVPSAEQYELELELPVSSVSGRVRGPDGRALANARITLAGEGPVKSGTLLGGAYSEAATDERGEYVLEWVPPGTYSVAAGGALLGGALGEGAEVGGREVRRGVVVEEGQHVRDVDFALSAPGAIEGAIVDAGGAPVAGVALFVRAADGAVLERFSMTASDSVGRFRYPGVRAGTYRLVARGAGWTADASAAVTVESGATAHVQIAVQRGTQLTIALVDADGTPQRAAVLVLDEDGHQVNGLVSMSEIMDALGKGGLSLLEERVGPLPAGRYRVSATAADGRDATKLVRLRADQTEERVTLKLRE